MKTPIDGIQQSQEKIIHSALSVLTQIGSITQQHRKQITGELLSSIKDTTKIRNIMESKIKVKPPEKKPSQDAYSGVQME